MSNSVGRNDNFRAKARKLSILPTSLDILIYGNPIYVFSIFSIYTISCLKLNKDNSFCNDYSSGR